MSHWADPLPATQTVRENMISPLYHPSSLSVQLVQVLHADGGSCWLTEQEIFASRGPAPTAPEQGTETLAAPDGAGQLSKHAMLGRTVSYTSCQGLYAQKVFVLNKTTYIFIKLFYYIVILNIDFSGLSHRV